MLSLSARIRSSGVIWLLALVPLIAQAQPAAPQGARAADFPSPIAIAQAPREVLQAVTLSARTVENQLTSGLDGRTSGHVMIEVRAELRGKFHLYEDKFAVWTRPVAGAEWPVEMTSRPSVHQFLDPVSRGLKPGYKGEAVFLVKASLPEALAQPLAPDASLAVAVGFQACSDKVCLLPIALEIAVPLSPSAASAAAAGSGESFFARFEKLLSSQLGGGGLTLTSLLVLVAAGLITAFTPCVYPLYPITLGLFSRWSQASRVSPFALALAYCAGIVLSYATLGVVSVATGSVFGSLTQTPAFLIGMGLFIVFAALVFAGVINLSILDRLQNAFAKPVQDGDKPASPLRVGAQAFGMGASLGIVASPCVGPVLVVILAWTASQVENASGGSAYALGFAYLALFGAGMSLPFLVIGHLILRMGRNPKLGRFTPYFKHIGTVLMLAASLFFLVPGVQLLMGSSLEAREADYEVLTLETWPKDKPTVIDFRADWCVACIELENETFTHPEVSEHFKRDEWDFVRVDLTIMDDAKKAIAAEYGVVGLPTVLLYDGNGRLCKDLRLIGFENAQDFQTRMKKAMAGCR